MLTFANLDIACPPGISPDRKLRGPCDLRILTGHVGEQVVAHVLGAEAYRGPAMKMPAGVVAHPMDRDSGYDIVPDLWWGEESAVVEVKAGLQGMKFYVTKRQLLSYRWLRVHSRIPIRAPRVYYGFVEMRHPLDLDVYAGKPLSRATRLLRLTAGEVLSRLMAGVVSVTVADLSIVLGWADSIGSNGHDYVTPLSPMLGMYEEYYRMTPARVLRWREEARSLPRIAHEERSMAVVLRKDRLPRRWEGQAPGTTRELF